MGCFTTIAVDNDQYELVINTIRNGFTDLEGKIRKPNDRIATALITETNLGVRISDVVKLRMCDIIKEGPRYHLDIIEQKTGKKRTFTVHKEFYKFLDEYCTENNINHNARIFPVTTRNVQKLLKCAVDTLELEKTSTHSFRKFAAAEIYARDKDIELVRQFLQQSSTVTTQAYLNRSGAQLEKALESHLKLV